MASIRSGCCKLLQRSQHPKVSKIKLIVTVIKTIQFYAIQKTDKNHPCIVWFYFLNVSIIYVTGTPEFPFWLKLYG